MPFSWLFPIYNVCLLKVAVWLCLFATYSSINEYKALFIYRDLFWSNLHVFLIKVIHWSRCTPWGHETGFTPELYTSPQFDYGKQKPHLDFTTAKSVFSSKSNCHNSAGWHSKHCYKIHPAQDLNSRIIRFDSNISASIIRGPLGSRKTHYEPSTCSGICPHCPLWNDISQNTETQSDYKTRLPCVINPHKDVSETIPFHVPDSFPPAVC